MKMTKAFTMIELIFVIVILGILSAIALPKFQGIRNQADIANAKAQVSTIRAAIANDRQRRLILGCSLYAKIGTGTFDCNADNTYNNAGTKYNSINNGTDLFGGVLTREITNSNTVGNWYTNNRGTGTYYYNLSGGDLTFTYQDDKNGTFECTATANTDVNCSIFN